MSRISLDFLVGKLNNILRNEGLGIEVTSVVAESEFHPGITGRIEIKIINRYLSKYPPNYSSILLMVLTDSMERKIRLQDYDIVYDIARGILEHFGKDVSYLNAARRMADNYSAHYNFDFCSDFVVNSKSSNKKNENRKKKLILLL